MNNLQPHTPRRAFIILGLAFTLCFLALIGRLVYIQLAPAGNKVSRAHLEQLADSQQTMTKVIPPFRGPILDRHGRALGLTVEAYCVFADPKLIHQGDPDLDRNLARNSLFNSKGQKAVFAPLVGLASGLTLDSEATENRARVARELGPILGLEPREIEERIAAEPLKRFVALKRRVDRDAKKAIDALKLWGVGTVPEGKREYPEGPLGVHISGVVGSEGQGLSGLEYLFDNRLRGEPGRRIVEVDGSGREIWIQEDGFKQPRDGDILVLTIDLTIQAYVEEALKKAVDKFHAKGAVAIVMDPYTGEVLALANYPNYDPENLQGVDAYAARNRCLTDPYELGSTAKCFVAAAALESGIVRPNEMINCHYGSFTIHGRRLTDVHPYGTMPFTDVVIHSSNIGMGILGDRMGNAKLHEALTRFGFGQKTGIWLPGEGKGLVYPLEKWSLWSSTSVSMGYEFLSTPLQLVTAFSSIANGGVLMKPRIVRYCYGSDRRLVADLSEPIAVRRALRRNVADFMKDKILAEVVSRGTGSKAAIPGYRVFGKTGTAKKRNPNGGGYSGDLVVGSFIGGAPLKDPRLVVLVAIDEPEKSLGYYGGTVAGPAVAEILQKSLAYLRVPADKSVQLAKGPTVKIND